MPIPNFDHNNVLPPHLGNPVVPTDLSPYECSTLEFCQHFATSTERIVILKNFVSFRLKMNAHGISNGFQWIDGSFTENVEIALKRPPNDLDVVTFVRNLTSTQIVDIKSNFADFIIPSLAKANYKLDHYAVDFGYDPLVTVEQTRYWLQLFSHNRLGVWKGMLRLELNTVSHDQDALDYLNALVI